MKHTISGKLLLSISLLCISLLNAQRPYTQKKYAIDTQLNIPYGTAVDFAGNSVELKLDIYKPVGDSNCRRPIVVLVHGGAWVGGSKEDVNIVALAREFSQRGWVAACINYRLGNHKAASYSMYALCNGNGLSQPCGYISDSAEVIRANFRGMQDAKGALRFMKMRYDKDSTDPYNAFIAGESAGAFIALSVAYTDMASEKHPACYAIGAAPRPDTTLYQYGCVPAPISRLRPDLGSIEGDLNTNSQFTAEVVGVGSIYGAVFDTALFRQTRSIMLPCVYLFHQGSDIIVHYNYGRLMGRVSYECYAPTNLCQPYYFYPSAYGGEGIRRYFSAAGSNAPEYTADIVSNYSYMNNCFSNGHAVDNIGMRAQNMCNLFAKRLEDNGNVPDKNCALNLQYESSQSAVVYPNPGTGAFVLLGMGPDAELVLTDLQGRSIALELHRTNDAVHFTAVSATEGVYVLNAKSKGRMYRTTLILQP